MSVAIPPAMLGTALSAPHTPPVRYRHPTSAGIVLWRRGTGSNVLTAVVKATFELVPDGRARLAARQIDLSTDVHGAAETGRLSVAGDWAPYKPLCDVSVIGLAYPSSGGAALGADVAVQVDDFVRHLRVPSWEPVQELAPLAPHARVMAAAGRAATEHWARDLTTSCPPAPPDVDFSFFNAAPADMQLERFGAEPLIVLDGLVPDRPSLVSRLPPISATATIYRIHGDEPLELRADTLWIDASEGVATLTWRAVCDLHGGMEEVRAVAFELQEDLPVPRPADSSPTMLLDLDQLAPGASSKPPPPVSGIWAVDEEHTYVGELPDRPSGPPLPFVAGPSEPPPSCAEDSHAIVDGDTVDSVHGEDGSGDSLPFDSSAPPEEPGEEPQVIGLERWAQLEAQLDLLPDERDRLLGEAELDEPSWQGALHHWKLQIQAEGRRGSQKAQIAHDDVYLAELERERGLVSLCDFAQLAVAAERDTVSETAASLAIPEAAILPLERVWNRRLFADPSLGKALKRALNRAHDARTTPTED